VTLSRSRAAPFLLVSLALLHFPGCSGSGGGGPPPPPPPPASNDPFWAQWGFSAQHAGAVPVAGQSLDAGLADIVYDPFVAEEQAEMGGSLVAHYPATLTDGDDFYVEMKTGSYVACAPRGAWFDGAACDGPFFITQLDADLAVEWRFQNTSTDTDHANGFEWCINAPAVDSAGVVYANSEDGNVYALPQGHSGVFTVPKQRRFLRLAIGAAYTPLAIGPDGRIYTQNDGHLLVIGN